MREGLIAAQTRRQKKPLGFVTAMRAFPIPTYPKQDTLRAHCNKTNIVQIKRIHPAKAGCRDLLIGFKCMPYVMRYNYFPY
ncbi:hypothetical protein [Rhizobium esperanzae]|uniref:hypothetical protein n=1 Tax=Rhizobium esperanzae TaxID=1967781 RepID=UPI0015962575|nr:hypothetical protein [Rhizobium esperanzae]